MKKANRQKGVIAKTAVSATVVEIVIAMTAGSAIAKTVGSAIAVEIVIAIIQNRKPKSLIIVE